MGGLSQEGQNLKEAVGNVTGWGAGNGRELGGAIPCLHWRPPSLPGRGTQHPEPCPGEKTRWLPKAPHRLLDAPAAPWRTLGAEHPPATSPGASLVTGFNLREKSSDLANCISEVSSILQSL